MSIVKYLSEKNLIQIDKTNPNLSKFDELFNYMKSENQEPIFVTHKQDFEDNNPNLSFIKIDSNHPYIKKNHYLVFSSKNYQPKTFQSKLDVIDFVRKNL